MHRASVCVLFLLTMVVLLITSKTASAQNRIYSRSRPSLSCTATFDQSSDKRQACTEARSNNPLRSYFERADEERVERLARRARPIAGSASCSGEGDFELKFQSQFKMEVFYDGKRIEYFNDKEPLPTTRFGPNGCHLTEYPETNKKYTAFLLIPNKEGGISIVPAKIVPENTGLTFTDPETGKGRK